MIDPSYPILVADGLDVHIFSNVEQVQMYIEAVDVVDNVYKSYDSTGRKVQLVANDINGPIWVVGTRVDCKVEMTELLQEYLRLTRPSMVELAPDLNSLLLACEEIVNG